MTVDPNMSEQGMANGYREYSSTMVSMYLLRVDEGSGPLKSTLRRCMGLAACINGLFSGL